MAPAFLRCESHSRRPLTEHLQDVAERLAAYGPLLRLAGLFHDIGKATDYFQQYLHGQFAGDFQLKQHAHLGAVWLLQHLWPKVTKQTIQLEEAIRLYLLVANHHTGLMNVRAALPPGTDAEAPRQERWTKQLQAIDHDGVGSWFARTCGEPVGQPNPHWDFSPVRRELFKLLDKRIPDSSAMQRFQEVVQSFGVLIEADRDSASGFLADDFRSPPRFTSGHLDRFRANRTFGAEAEASVIQARERLYRTAVGAAADRPADSGHLWCLTSPTGAGKTLAALGWALRRRELRIAAGLHTSSIIYALPFTSIIDQNASVLRRIWGNDIPDESTLAVHHHVAEPGELATSGEQSLARSWVEGWRADIVCTTFVQVVNALFHGTVADSRRFSRLAGSILILDEVQAIPAKFWTVFNVALQTLSSRWKSDVLLMTATQPAIFVSSELHELHLPLPKLSPSAFNRYDLYINTEQELTLTGLAEQVRAVVAEPDAPSVLVIVNTIREALELFFLVKTFVRLDPDSIFHLSTNLRPKDRKRILDEIAKRQGGPHLLIATQVVEAGVDLSFDVVFRALAPLDAIVQAAGRCNRHGTGRRGRVLLVRAEGNTGQWIYGDKEMGAAREVLKKAAAARGQLSEPQLQECVAHYFRLVAEYTGGATHDKVMEAIRMWEFSFLRGEGIVEKKDQGKAIQLIDNRGDTVPHYVETDPSDVELWHQFCDALNLAHSRQRRSRLRDLRPALGQRIVEVPQRFASVSGAVSDSESTGLIHVAWADASTHYDINTGWKRGRV